MKVTIVQSKKKIYVKGDLRGKTPEDAIEELLQEASDYKIEVEQVYTSKIENTNNKTTTISQL